MSTHAREVARKQTWKRARTHPRTPVHLKKRVVAKTTETENQENTWILMCYEDSNESYKTMNWIKTNMKFKLYHNKHVFNKLVLSVPYVQYKINCVNTRLRQCVQLTSKTLLHQHQHPWINLNFQTKNENRLRNHHMCYHHERLKLLRVAIIETKW
jgi:hypothetical protein